MPNTTNTTQKNNNKNPGPVMLDIEGLQLNEADIQRIRHPLTGGVILFTRNFESRTQLLSLIKAIRAERSDILIAVDHEGGRVQRFKKDGFTHLPPMQKLGELWDKNPLAACKAAVSTGYILASELRACGVDLSFTPVLDLNYGESGVIGDRSFHSDPEIVTQLAQNLNHGLLLAGMANCGKHFPGHGFVREDSHTEIPVDNRKLEDILSKDAAPYNWLGIGLSGVMPAHVIYPEVDSSPAGFSPKWLSILRNDIGFEGVIFSDDLSMEGASVAGDIISRSQAALDAGCDMVLICNSPDKADQLLAGLKLKNDKKTYHSQQRLLQLFPAPFPLGWDELQNEPRYKNAQKVVAELMQD